MANSSDIANKVVQPMDSYRLARYAVPLPCYLCSGDNCYDADVCRHCQAPMALAHQAYSEKIHPQIFGVVGPAGAGKTVYLGMLLDLLSRGATLMQVLARGAFSITLQQTTIAALARCEFPDKTPNEPDYWNWVHCQLSIVTKRRPFDLIMPDVAGESVLEEVDHPRSYPVIRSLLTKGAATMILVDAADVASGRQHQDFFAMKILTYLSELDEQRKRRRRSRPVAVVFTKADECPRCFEDPEEFARHRTPGLYKQCRQQFRRHAFFAVGVAGACGQRSDRYQGTVRVPLRIEPRGVVEPFEWVVGQVKRF